MLIFSIHFQPVCLTKDLAKSPPMPFPAVVSLAIVMAATFLVTLMCLWKLRKRQGTKNPAVVKRAEIL